jgi:uncharacterized iron-regulated membrane protein
MQTNSKPAFRKSMNALHTWAGVVLGSLIFVIFWMGTLSVFDREIDRWMMPATRLAAPSSQASIKLDGAVTGAAMQLAKGAPQWFFRLPSERVPAIELRWRNEATKAFERRFLHPQTGAVLADADTLAGTGFIFPFHYTLHIKWVDLGEWLVGLAGMAMLLMVVSGVVTHRRLFADFFTFRPKKKMQRASLDLHNLMGVLALPFHFLMPLSGVILLFALYWPSAHMGQYAQATNVEESKKAFTAEAYGQYKRAKANQPAQSAASLDAMLASAEKQWPGGKADFVRVWLPGDANSYVELRRSYASEVAMNLDQIYLDAATGKVLKRFEAAPVMAVQRFTAGAHRVLFDHWTLRWLYFLGGLSGCIMIATGFLFWLESRRTSHAKHGLAGVRVVEALTVFTVPGIIIATLAFFIANRLLPAGASVGGYGRATLEMWAFYGVWLATLAHAGMRVRWAWREQAVAIGFLAVLAVLLNWLTTRHHLAASLQQGMWAVAGMDLALLTAASLAWVAVRRLRANGAMARPKAPQAAAQPLQGDKSHA